MKQNHLLKEYGFCWIWELNWNWPFCPGIPANPGFPGFPGSPGRLKKKKKKWKALQGFLCLGEHNFTSKPLSVIRLDSRDAKDIEALYRFEKEDIIFWKFGLKLYIVSPLLSGDSEPW